MKARLFARKLVGELGDDEILDVAAMMTYYAIFALFPMLVFAITVALLVVPPELIQEVVALATETVPPQIAPTISEQVERMQAAAGAGFAIGGAVLALWGASRGASALGGALNRVYDKQETRPWWRRQLIAIAVTLGVAILVFAALGLIALGPIAGLPLLRWAAAAFILMLVWAILYKFLPDTDAPFRIFTPGAAIGVLLWIAVTQGFALYLDNFADYEKTYGTLTGVIIFLFWLWLSNLAILVGAEINDVLADVRRGESPAAAQLSQAET